MAITTAVDRAYLFQIYYDHENNKNYIYEINFNSDYRLSFLFHHAGDPLKLILYEDAQNVDMDVTMFKSFCIL